MFLPPSSETCVFENRLLPQRICCARSRRINHRSIEQVTGDPPCASHMLWRNNRGRWSIEKRDPNAILRSFALSFTLSSYGKNAEDELDRLPAEHSPPWSPACRRHSQSPASATDSDLFYGHREPQQSGSVQSTSSSGPPAYPAMVSQPDLLPRSSE